MSIRAEQLSAARALIAAEPAQPPGPARPGPADRGARLNRLCRAAARALPAWGTAVTVMTAEGVQPVAVASDPRTQALEEQQFSFGEGPCVDAFAGRRPVLEPDLAGQARNRWPAYTPAAQGEGVGAVFAFPLQIGAARLGVLDIYLDRPGSLSPVALGQALTFAEVALWVLLEGQAEAASDRPAEGLESAVDSRSELFQAQGMVMIQLGVSLADAMSQLRAHAYAQNRRLGDVARDVVARRLQLEPDRVADGPVSPGE
jgi:ANTAR domain-containing protein/GAF domain-containing protein